ncbi:Ig-like domain-containing protein [Staphylococcus shinii]|uniref:YSIRK-type signal peptide-containing protein n=1 Tax=Staphylococcus shinii TaxID=2912228 RepID=A0A418IHV9_9STAP|nr:Ig-like domain-containing protein [Staphylococcus shinii]RIN02302.1 YSIRK-type signal peptide-containing protein [Staphylococcus shinii]
MKNRQGFLPNRLNKYSIRKFTVGTASLLIGATLVMGVGNEAQADELDSITSDNASTKDKGEALDINDIKSVEENNSTEEKTEEVESESKDTLTQEKTENSKNEPEESTVNENSDNQIENEKPETEKVTSEKSKTEETNTEQKDSDHTNTVEDQTSSSDYSEPETVNDKDATKENSNEEANKSNLPSKTERPSTEIAEKTNSVKTEKPLNKNSDSEKASKTKQPQKDNNKQVTKSQKTDVKNDKEETSGSSTSASKVDKSKAITIKDKKKTKNTKSKLEAKLATTKDKKSTVESFLNSQLSETETKAIMDNTDINYETATDEEINTEILKASIIELVNNQESVTTLATPTRTMFRAMATPTALAAAVDQSEEVEKSLGYLDNYTFASLIFDPGSLDNQTTLNSNVIPFDIHSYMSGSNSGDRYKIDLKLDPIIAQHVTKITVNPAGRSKPVEFIRLTDENGKVTNTWEVNFIRANDGLFGGAEILSQYTATNGKIELDDTVANILKNAGSLDNNKLNYQMFVRDSTGNRIVRTSESSGYFLTSTDSDLVGLEKAVSSENSNTFKASSGSAAYDDAPGEYGGFIIDQQIMKNGIFSYSKTRSNQWSYHYQIDKDLLPYIESVELHKYDYQGLGGFDKTYHEADKVADLTLDAIGNGSITSDNLNKLIEFNNLLPETVGVRIVIKLNQSVNNILTKDAEYDAQGNLIRETTKQKEDFTFAGYLTDSKGSLINNTLGTSTLALQDYDKDGLLDRYERQVSLSNPENNDTDGDGKNDGDEVINYKTSPLVGKPEAADITNKDTVVTGSVPLKEGAASQTAKVIDANGKVIGTSTVNSDGRFSVSIPQSPEGTYTIAIDSPNYENDEVSTFNIIDISKVPTPSINPVDDNDTEIQVNGTAGATVTVRDNNNNEIGSVQIPSDGSAATIVLNQPLTAGTVLTATASKDGKTSEISDQITVTDETAPDAPVINPITSNDKQVTGTAEPNSSVTVGFSGGGKVSVTADDQGNFTVNIPNGVILEGGEEFKAISTDKAGNESAITTTTVKDMKAPDAPIIKDVTSNSNRVTGTAEANSTVKVTFPSGTVVETTADDNGNFTVNIPSDEGLEGGETIQATSTDDAGNVSQSGNTTVTDATAPDAPQISHVTSVSTEVTGTAEANSTVKVTFPSGTVVETTADDNGNFTVNIPLDEGLEGGERIQATSTDATGNVSSPGSTTVTDETAPAPPTVNGVTSEDAQVTGTAEANSTVTIKFPNGVTVSGEADSDGNYRIAIPDEVDLVGGEEIQVISTDDAGNETAPVVTTVTDVTAPDAPTVKDVTSEDAQVRGTAEANSTVTITFPDGTTATGTTDDQGNYTVNIPERIDLTGNELLKVTASDSRGNISPEVSTTVVDATAPKAPVLNEVSSEDTQVTGTTEANSTVTVTFPGGVTVNVDADNQGNFSVSIPDNVVLTGGEQIHAIAQDKANNKSEQATTTVVDATAPDTPTVEEVTSEDTQVKGTAEPGSEVTVTFPDGTTAIGTADDEGKYTIDIPNEIDLVGGEELLIASIDNNGNISDSVKTTVVDTTAPEAPTANEVTSEDTQVKGTAEPGSTVTVTFPDGTTATGTADDQGNYTVEIPSNVDLNGGEELVVTSKDKEGNTSEEATTTVVDTTAPEAPTVNEVTSEDTQVKGTAEPGSTVTVTFPDGTTATGTADDQGNYTVEIPSNVNLDGDETIKVVAEDKDGNTSEEATTTVTDTTAPEAPTVNEITSEDTQVKGTAEPGSEVTVTFPDGTTATGTADDQGNYTVEIPSNVNLDGDETIKVVAEDKDGNTSEEATTTVVDTTAPEAPTVNEVTSEDTQVKGTAEPGSTVTVTFPDGITATGTADDQGNYTVEIPSNVNLDGGEELVVTSKDKNGNTSEEATTTVTDTTAPEAPTVNEVTSEDTTVSGTAEPGSTVTVTFPDGTTATGTADDQGNYTVEIPSNVNLDGDETIKVVAEDKNGNTSEEATTTVTDTTVPEAPTVNEVTSEDTQVKGTAEPGSTVTVTFPDGTTATGTADEEGNDNSSRHNSTKSTNGE